MDRKLDGTRSLESELNLERCSAFEMSISPEYLDLEFQTDAPQIKIAVPKAGDPCPQCQLAQIDYDGMLNLSCTDCGYTLAGCFT